MSNDLSTSHKHFDWEEIHTVHEPLRQPSPEPTRGSYEAYAGELFSMGL